MQPPVWIEEHDALALHDRLLSLHGGVTGVRDRGLLQSALARPQQHFAYGAATKPVELGAIYSSAIVRNHLFIDGNKRTGFVIGVLFIEMNGFVFTASEEAAAQAVIALASHDLSEEGFTAFLESNCRPA